MEEPGLDYPTLGKQYLLFRDGEYIGNGFFVKDPHHGEVFIEKKGDENLVYFDVDSWVEVKQI